MKLQKKFFLLVDCPVRGGRGKNRRKNVLLSTKLRGKGSLEALVDYPLKKKTFLRLPTYICRNSSVNPIRPELSD